MMIVYQKSRFSHNNIADNMHKWKNFFTKMKFRRTIIFVEKISLNIPSKVI